MNEVTMQASWLPWAVLSAVFAALTAIFAKVGLEGVDSDFATLIRTVVIALVLLIGIGWLEGIYSTTPSPSRTRR